MFDIDGIGGSGELPNSEEQRILREKGLTYNTTDTGNSQRFVDRNKGMVLYLTEESRWIGWDGTRWASIGKTINELAKDTVKSIYDEARDCNNRQGQVELSNWAKRSQQRHLIESMLDLSKGALEAHVSDFDNDFEKLNCENGIVWLPYGSLEHHHPGQLVTKKANVNFEPSAKCPTWNKFLRDIFLGDEELIAFFKRAIGYTATGHTKEDCLFIAYGLGANGKTTLFETLLEILGDYGRSTEFNSFLSTDKTDVRNREAIGMLKGIRFAIASETDSNRKWNEALIKKLTGGDTLIGAKLHGSSYEFKPTHKLWFQANHLPNAKDASHGFWRRPIVIPFNAKFEGRAIDPNLKQKLLAEREGIFAWIVQGAIEYFRYGLGQRPRACLEATAQYREANDILSKFIREKLEPAYGATIGVDPTYRLYEEWCASEREEPVPLKFFTRYMEERGVTTRRTRGCRVFYGYTKNEKPSVSMKPQGEVLAALPFAPPEEDTHSCAREWRKPTPQQYLSMSPVERQENDRLARIWHEKERQNIN
jgi:putative DNA primase/helicase